MNRRKFWRRTTKAPPSRTLIDLAKALTERDRKANTLEQSTLKIYQELHAAKDRIAQLERIEAQHNRLIANITPHMQNGATGEEVWKILRACGVPVPVRTAIKLNEGKRGPVT